MPAFSRALRFFAAPLLFCLWLGASASAQELVLGGRASFEPRATLSPRLDQRLSIESITTLAPSLSVRGDLIEFRAQAAVRHAMPGTSPSGSVELELEELELSVFPSDSIAVRIGRFDYRPGRALMLSPNNFFQTVSYEALLGAGPEFPSQANSIVQLRLLGPQLYAVATVAPVPNVPQLTEPGSIWLPDVGLPPTINDPNLSPEPVEFNESFSEETRPIAEPWRRVSAGIEFGATLGAVDLAVLYYRGVDPVAVPRARVDFPRVPLESYDLYFAPEEVQIDAFGLVAEAVLADANMWADTGLTAAQPISTDQVDSLSKRTDLVEPPALEAVFGASYQFGRPNLLLIGEYRRLQPLWGADRPPELIATPLDNDLLLSATMRLGRRLDWSISPGALVSLDDASAALALSLEYQPQASLRVYLRSPLFLGTSDSDYGQYAGIFTVESGIEYRF